MRRYAKSIIVKLLLAVLLLPASLPLDAQEQEVNEDFVIASLLISEPGGALYSRLGHAALHMQCPEHNLDYVFTYEGENLKDHPLRFLAGKLKMGMLAVDPGLYIDEHVRHGRGLKEYRLNLPIEKKRELWRALDSRLLEGIDLKYDYLHHGCAHSVLMSLKEALGSTEIEYGAWPDHFEGASRREVTYHFVHEDKWTTFLLHFIVNGEIDRRGCSNEDKVIIPSDLLFVLQNAVVCGTPVIDSEPVQVVSSGHNYETGWFSPMAVAVLLLVLTIACSLFGIKMVDYVLLGIQTLLGLAEVFLLCSSLVCTEWSWLIIPFNPLPLIFWKWRRKWALPYAIVLLVWCAFMLFWPHMLTDGAYIVAAICLAVSYVGIRINSKTDEEEHNVRI